MEDITKKMQFILDNYNDGTTTVDSKSKVYQKLCVEIPELLREMIKRDDLIVKGSMGNGNKNFVPWISIINRNIAAGTQEGLYVVFLFKKDMSGFYLSLNQGITNFINMFRPRKSAYSNAVLVADYFRNELDETTFSKNPISLEVSKGLGFGYQCTNIVSKFYPSGKISKKMLADDLNEIIELYDLIVKHMGTRNYNDIINEVLADESEDFLCSDDALNTIAQTVDPDDEMPFGYYRELIEVDPHRERSTRFSRMTRPRTGKIDYVKKAAKDAKYGLLGEGFVIDYEKNGCLN